MTRDEAIILIQKLRTFHNGTYAKAIDMAIEALERPHGEWIERNVTQDRRDAKIPEWQSAKCSVCGKYHTTPYMYYFKKYNYCPFCGARMDERREDDEIH